MTNYEIAIQCWNIYGIFTNVNGFIYSKLQDPDFHEHVLKNKIFGLVETHHTDEDIDKLHILNYKCFQTCRKKKNFGRKHGGIAVYIHNTILGGVSKVPTQGSENIILKLKKDFFKLDKDTILTFSYCVPSNSSYAQRTQFDAFADLEQKLGGFIGDHHLICLGDFNARTGTKLDYITNEDNSNLTLPSTYETDRVATYPRGNMDRTTNVYGDKLISLCKSVPLRVCNGRKLGDILGSYTCHKWNGQSTVDYCLASPGIYDKISVFKVNDFIPNLSDHCSISFKLKTNAYSCAKIFENYEFVQKPTKVKWDKKIELNFENILQSADSKLFLSNFAKNGILPDQNCVDNATAFLTEFLVNSVELASNLGHRIEFKCPKKSSQPNWKFRRKKTRKIYRPKWHDETCDSLLKKIKHSAFLLKKHPNNSYLRGCLQLETKQYRKLMKSNHKKFINNLFENLDSLHKENPRGYMNLVKSLRDGTFDKKVADDSTFVSPENWRSHFSALLDPPSSPPGPADELMTSYINEHCDRQTSELSHSITKLELLRAISSLDNNKSSSFDRISNEMLKASKLIIHEPLLILFNSILHSIIYPTQWKLDILSPLHKAGDKSDPNNYRGISVSSCLGKLFNKILQKRLETFCNKNLLISDVQGSGKSGSRTADHLLIVRFLIDKYVKIQGKRLFTCFVDLKKAFDMVPRNKLFYTLLKEYSIGGNFLKMLQEIYKNNKIFIKTGDGLLQPITTSIGVKQGCVFSPLLFNLFINKISSIFDQTCSPVKINNVEMNCLLWADDLLLFSETETGLQNSINKMQTFYESLDLPINIKKTKVLIFNKQGIKLDKLYNFTFNGQKLEITDEYQYLGLKLRPSGSMQAAVQELNDKASRAWFGISHVIYKNKRMAVDKVFGLFDSLVTPVALYGCEFWLPFILSKNSLKNEKNLFDSWETFLSEKLNQKCCRMILSVHNKSSRLAVLGELARYPLFIKALSHCLNYKLSLEAKKSPNLVSHVMSEMQAMSVKGQDCWLTRVDQLVKLLNLSKPRVHNKTSGKSISSFLQSKFDRHWLDKINEFKSSKSDNMNHNKLRTYSTFKASFTREPYLSLVQNRNQRAFLTRLRVGSHNLAVELGRRTRPITPFDKRICVYCRPPPSTTPSPCRSTPATATPDQSQTFVDTEVHFLVQCSTFNVKRNCMFGKMSSLLPNFMSLTSEEKFVQLLCPVTAQAAKLASKFIKIMVESRKKLDDGSTLEDIGFRNTL